MLKNIRLSIAEWFFKSELDAILGIQQTLEQKVNQRVAEVVSKMDPFEPLMKEFHGIFSEEYQHPEQQLNAQGQFAMEAFGYQITNDPSFKYLSEWIQNQHGNALFKTPHLTRETAPELILYAKAQISTMVLFRKEVSRLANLYRERVEKGRGEIITNSTVGE